MPFLYHQQTRLTTRHVNLVVVHLRSLLLDQQQTDSPSVRHHYYTLAYGSLHHDRADALHDVNDSRFAPIIMPTNIIILDVTIIISLIPINHHYHHRNY